jgi:prevent-host-death family protein
MGWTSGRGFGERNRLFALDKMAWEALGWTMSTHDIAEAESHLSDLIDQALKGEAVVITRQGKPVAEIRPVNVAKRRMTEADIAWIEANRVKPRGDGMDPVALVSKMRDEDWP